MNMKIINMILNRRTITMYTVVIILLFAVTPGQKGVINILAGFSHRRAEDWILLGLYDGTCAFYHQLQQAFFSWIWKWEYCRFIP